MTINDEPRCSICGKYKVEHEGLHHQFSVTGELLPIDDDKRSSRAQQISSLAADGMLLRLIAMLARKGVLEEAEMLQLFGGGNARHPADRDNATADHRTGSPESSS